jgi:hypothetical protein
MSKASEWVKRVSDANEARPLGFSIGPNVRAAVTGVGHCEIRGQGIITPDEAVALAAYLIDTFGDTPTSPTSEGDSK